MVSYTVVAGSDFTLRQKANQLSDLREQNPNLILVVFLIHRSILYDAYETWQEMLYSQCDSKRIGLIR